MQSKVTARYPVHMRLLRGHSEMTVRLVLGTHEIAEQSRARQRSEHYSDVSKQTSDHSLRACMECRDKRQNKAKYRMLDFS